MGLISAISRSLIKDIVNNTEPGTKDTITGLAKDYLANLDLAYEEYLDSKCPHNM